MLVEDELDAPRSSSSSRSSGSPQSSRSRVEKEFLSENFAERIPARHSGDIVNDVRVRRVLAQKGALPGWTRTRWGRYVFAALVLAVVSGVVFAALAVRSFFEHDARFRIDSSASIETVGNSQLTRQQLLSVFGADIGRNIFYIPLAERRAELERIPWVEHATVMRILPDELRVTVRERTPVAFVRVGDQIKLVDGAGVILDMSPAMMAARKFSFPVVTGVNPTDPPATRAARMGLYEKFIHALAAGSGQFVANLSEVDLSDPEDVKVTVPMKASDLLLHFGDKNFQARYQIYEAHLSGWEQQYPLLAVVDLRYENEVVLKMSQGSGLGAQGSGEQGSAISDQGSGTQGSGSGAQGKVAAKKKAVARKRAHSVRRHSTHHVRTSR